MKDLVPLEAIQNKIYLIRGQKVMLDNDLAALYQVSTKRLNEQVKRNLKRFPDDFMIRLTEEENNSLRSHFATLKRGKHKKYLPYAFTEQGVAMLSSILNSERAIQVNIAIMRAFIKLREVMSTHKELARKIDDMEKKYDAQFKVVFEAIRRLLTTPEKPKKRIGFYKE
jgi:hypothetical protein